MVVIGASNIASADTTENASSSVQIAEVNIQFNDYNIGLQKEPYIGNVQSLREQCRISGNCLQYEQWKEDKIASTKKHFLYNSLVSSFIILVVIIFLASPPILLMTERRRYKGARLFVLVMGIISSVIISVPLFLLGIMGNFAACYKQSCSLFYTTLPVTLLGVGIFLSLLLAFIIYKHKERIYLFLFGLSGFKLKTIVFIIILIGLLTAGWRLTNNYNSYSYYSSDKHLERLNAD